MAVHDVATPADAGARLIIISTTFLNRDKGRGYGIRLKFGDYTAYDDTWDELPDYALDVFSQACLSMEEGVIQLLDMARQAERAAYVDGLVLGWAEIEPYLRLTDDVTAELQSAVPS